MLGTVKKIHGVSLVEVMLVLFISSLIAIAAFQYQKTKNENDVAAVYAQRMYEFSQAVRTYVDEHEFEIEAGMSAPFTAADAPGSTFVQSGSDYIITGVDWLTVVISPVTGRPYLPETFTFENMPPLALQRSTDPSGAGAMLEGNQAVETTISAVPGAVSQISIMYGGLYDVADPNLPAVQKPSVTSKATKIASALNDPLVGPSAFNYVGGSIDANGVMEPILATIKQSTVRGESYLRLDGTNKMLDNIEFESSAIRRDIKEINDLVFGTAQSTSKIDNVKAINFIGADGNINDIKDINFISAGGKMNDVKAINFISAGGIMNDVKAMNFISAGGNINDVVEIKFLNGYKFRGIQNMGIQDADGGHTGIKTYDVVLGGKQMKPNTHFCALSSVDTDAGGSVTRCLLRFSTDAPLRYIIQAEQKTDCAVICMQFQE